MIVQRNWKRLLSPHPPSTFSGTSGCRCLSRKLFALHFQKNNCRGSEIWMISYVVKVLYLPYYMASNYWENAIFWGEKYCIKLRYNILKNYGVIMLLLLPLAYASKQCHVPLIMVETIYFFVVPP